MSIPLMHMLHTGPHARKQLGPRAAKQARREFRVSGGTTARRSDMFAKEGISGDSHSIAYE